DITWTCADDPGHTSYQQEQWIHVHDTTPPVLGAAPVIPPLDSVTDAGTELDYTVPTATDNCALMMVTCTPPPGSVIPNGTTNVECVAEDLVGLTSTLGFSVKVLTPLEVHQDVLAQLQALASTPELELIIERLTEAVDPSLWIDGSHLVAKKGRRVFNADYGAARHMEQDPALGEYYDRIIQADQVIVRVAIADSVIADPVKIALASALVIRGNGNADLGHPGRGLGDLRRAWRYTF